MKELQRQLDIIKEDISDLISEDELILKLKRSIKEHKPLKIKLGLDPSAPDLHLGHSIVLRKLKKLQDLGHEIIIIIGDFTGKIGDPTGKSRLRKQISSEEVLTNAKTYEEQMFKILDREKTTVKFNSEWLSNLNFKEIIELSSNLTVARMLEREDFKLRYENQKPIFLSEFLYPLMQAYDSAEVDADIEFGGTDQRFNLIAGRNIQRQLGKEPQVVITMPLIEGLDGKNKMSKTLGNYIGISESAKVKYQKIMEIPDELIIKYYRLLTDIDEENISNIENMLKNPDINPRDIKMDLAREIVSLYHSKEETDAAEDRFRKIFQMGERPEDINTIKVNQNDFNITDIVVKNGLVSSKSEFRRIISQGGVKINDKKIMDEKDIPTEGEFVIKIGKKKFLKVVLYI